VDASRVLPQYMLIDNEGKIEKVAPVRDGEIKEKLLIENYERT
jgi:hypothetical protein